MSPAPGQSPPLLSPQHVAYFSLAPHQPAPTFNLAPTSDISHALTPLSLPHVQSQPLTILYQPANPTITIAVDNTAAGGRTSQTVAVPKGFGSFHTVSIEFLIHLSDEDYKRHQPSMPVDVDTHHRLQSALSNHSSTDTGSECDRVRVPYPIPSLLSTWPASQYRALFSLDPSCTFLNHGAFGAALRCLSDISYQWQQRMESQPLRFIDRELLPLIAHTTRAAAKFFGAKTENFLLTANVTTGMTCVMRTIEHYHHYIRASAGSSGSVTMTGATRTLLRTNLCYGSVKKLINELGSRTGTNVREITVTFPTDSDTIVQFVRDAISECSASGCPVSVLFMDHITSNTALRLPIERLMPLFRANGIVTVIDGAHAPFSVPSLSMSSIDADFYVGNFHKWLCNPKGAGFLCVSDRVQSQYGMRVQPPTVSHGFGTGLHSEFAWTGTDTYASQLTVLSALRLWQSTVNEHTMADIRDYSGALCRWAKSMLMSLWNVSDDGLTSDESLLDIAMTLVPLPPITYTEADTGSDTVIEGDAIQNCLYYRYQIECPVKTIQSRFYVRVSSHCYNSVNDYYRLALAINEIRAAPSLLAAGA